jgi:tetratricopeptide (TPR) repeat protein
MRVNLLNNIGMVYRRMGKLDQALEYLHDTLKVLSSLGYIRRLADCLRNIGDIFKEQGKDDEAMDSYLRALPLAIDAGNPRTEATLHYELALQLWKRGNHQEAIAELQTARMIRLAHKATTDAEDKLLEEWLSDTAAG